jgi:alanyl-tRNA synthetase
MDTDGVTDMSQNSPATPVTAAPPATGLTAHEVRRAYLDFFVEQGHAEVASSSLIPADDPTLYFTNAGMVQFKDLFTGVARRDYVRATTCQKCMRVSGKHNDLDNVGRTARHHTLFEMLGNFSFGDYFKAEAIRFAWTFLTEKIKLDPDRLTVTVFETDDEAYALWRDMIGVPESRISRLGAADNFWSMGDTGPCGPCTEIFFDKGPDAGVSESDRVMEIWNLVFMQFERHADGTQTNLPKPSVDTGMGLERLLSVLQGKSSNYDTDLFQPVIQAMAKKAGVTYGHSDAENDVSLRVIADHARAAAFLIGDGILPGNDGREYVLRRIMRRAIRHGRRLGFDQPFYHEACGVVVENMGLAYPELVENRAFIEKVAYQEEERFRATLDRGLKIFSDVAASVAAANGKTIPGADAFKLKDTYGFPLDLTEQLALERGLGVDAEGFHREDEAARARQVWAGSTAAVDKAVYETLRQKFGATTFTGYDADDAVATTAISQALAFVVGGAEAASAQPGNPAGLIAHRTPFYAESGGQVGDTGYVFPLGPFTSFLFELASGPHSDALLAWLGLPHSVVHAAVEKLGSAGNAHEEVGSPATARALNTVALALGEKLAAGAVPADIATVVTARLPVWGDVTGTTKPVDGLFVHAVTVHGQAALTAGPVLLAVDGARRQLIRANHSATHLMHLALQRVLGDHVRQAGSQVSPERLRFDYTHFEPLTRVQQTEIEKQVNAAIRANAPAATDVTDLATARARGAMALFGEKYGDRVRMVTLGDSIELCGGTHVRRTGDIGLFKIVSDAGVAAGVRRIEAVTGALAVAEVQTLEDTLYSAAGLLKAGPVELVDRVEKLTRREKDLQKEIDDLKRKLALGASATGASDTSSDTVVGGVHVVTTLLPLGDAKLLREVVDQKRDSLKSAVVVVGSVVDGKALIVCGTTPDAAAKVGAGDVIKAIAPIVGGRGGGKPDLAQAGGPDGGKVAEALNAAKAFVTERLG